MGWSGRFCCWPRGKPWGFIKHWAAKCPILPHSWQVILDLSLKGILESVALGVVFALGRDCCIGLGIHFCMVLGDRFNRGGWLYFNHISVPIACVCASVMVVGFGSRICDLNSFFRFKRYLFTASCSSNLILIRLYIGFVCWDWIAYLISLIICRHLSVQFWTVSVVPCIQLSSFDFKAKIEFSCFRFWRNASNKTS